MMTPAVMTVVLSVRVMILILFQIDQLKHFVPPQSSKLRLQYSCVIKIEV